MALPIAGLIASKALPMLASKLGGLTGKSAAGTAAGAVGGGGKSAGGGAQAPVTSPPIMSGAENIQPDASPNPFRVAPEDTPPAEAAPEDEKKKVTPKDVMGGIGKVMGGIGKGLSQMPTQQAPVLGPKITSEMPVSEPVTGLTDAFDKLARQRVSVAKNLMG